LQPARELVVVKVMVYLMVNIMEQVIIYTHKVALQSLANTITSSILPEPDFLQQQIPTATS
jgi:hypothetical protein